MRDAMKATQSRHKCPHAETERRIETFGNGTLHHCMQCLACGSAVGKWLANDGKQYPPFDQELRKTGSDLSFDERQREKQAERQEFQDRYTAYLESAEWKRKRRRVLERDAHICQGCLSAPAAVVHHTTYRHVGAELLFELISLCRSCHDRAHAHSTSKEPTS